MLAKTPTRTWKCTRCIMQMSYLYASDFPFKNFCKIAQHTETVWKNVWANSSDAYSLSIRVQTTINHISIFTFLCFLWQYQRQRKCFLSERELGKALRDTLTRAAWLGPGNFWLVRSEHAHASCPGLFFRPPGFSPYKGREERRVQGLDYVWRNKGSPCFALRPRVFHQIPCFPPEPVFSTTACFPHPGTPAPRFPPSRGQFIFSAQMIKPTVFF